MSYETPDNLVELLDAAVRAASRTAFYRPALEGRTQAGSLEDFAQIPITPLECYRRQRLADVLAEPSRVEWIAGRYKGHSASSVAVAEGPEEGANRYDLFIDAIKQSVPPETLDSCAVVTSAEKRYYAAEIATILIRWGVPSHVFIDRGGARTYERLHHVCPDLLVVLSDGMSEPDLPASIRLCVTFRRAQRMVSFRQLDMYLVDELGFLGHSNDLERYTLNKDMYYFERGDDGKLIVTALYNRVQPMLRIQTTDKVRPLGSHILEFMELSSSP